MSKYDPLGTFLAKSAGSRISMTFKEIEKLLGHPLPASAYTHPAWWSNTGGSHVQAQAWLDRGFRTEQVDLAGEKLVFVRAKEKKMMNEPQGMGEASQMPIPGSMQTKRHPAIGAMKGMITVMPGVDLTAPVDPEWIERLYDENATAGDLVGGLDDPMPGR